MEWINVKDKLPPAGERVLATDGCFVIEGYISKKKIWHRHNGYSWKNFFVTDVTHWMPMPKPPSSHLQGEADCWGYEQATNADRIRAMSDEELAEYLCGLIYCCECKYQDTCNDFGGDGYLKWLKQPAEESLHG